MAIDYNENDIAIICVSVSDRNGMIVPTADNEIEFTISENGVLLGGSNGNPSDHTLADSLIRRVFMGRAQIIIKTDGKVTLDANGVGLKSASICI